MVEAIETLCNFGFPTVIAVLVALFILIKGFESIWKWGMDKFLYFYNRKKNSDKLVQDVGKHNNEIQYIHEKIDRLVDAIEKQNKKNDKYDRDMARIILLDMYDKYKQQGYITMIQLQSYDSLYTSYTDKGGNGLIKDMVDPIIRGLEVKD